MCLIRLIIREAADAGNTRIRSAALLRGQTRHRADRETLRRHRQVHARQLTIAVCNPARNLAALIGARRRHICRRAVYQLIVAGYQSIKSKQTTGCTYCRISYVITITGGPVFACPNK